jgi:hypothetical protein
MSATEEFNCFSKGFLGLVGQVLQNRFLVCSQIGEGSYGKVFTCQDLVHEGKVLHVVKF